MRKTLSQQWSSANPKSVTCAVRSGLLGGLSEEGRGHADKRLQAQLAFWLCMLVTAALLWSFSGLAQANDQLQRKPEGGSQTVAVKARDALSYNASAPLSRKSGSGQASGVEAKVGFGCGNGKQWAVIKDEIKCGETLTGGGEVAALLSGGKSLYVQANLISGFRTGRFLRITGTNVDVRVDMFALDGSVTGSCFLTQGVDACHLGSPNGANSGLAAAPQFPTTGGQMRYASELVEGNLAFAGNRTGGALQDAYIASVVKTNAALTVYFVGLHHLDGSQGSQLQPIYSRGSFSWDALAGMMGLATEITWATPNSWSANTP
jgi:hypothetical protein